MTRSGILMLAVLALPLGVEADEPIAATSQEVAQLVAGHLEARGGEARWREVDSLALSGSYSAFSQRAPFTLIRRRGDLYRLDFTLLGGAAVRARDSDGPWWQHALLQPDPARLTEGPYKPQLERESLFGPLLLDWQDKGIELQLLGPGEIDGQPTTGVQVILADGTEETWHLDAETLLEVAVDSLVSDHTQAAEPMAQRTFYDDFREVDGLVLPFLVESEFGARLESMRVEEATVDPELDDSRFQGPSSGDPADS